MHNLDFKVGDFLAKELGKLRILLVVDVSQEDSSYQLRQVKLLDMHEEGKTCWYYCSDVALWSRYKYYSVNK